MTAWRGSRSTQIHFHELGVRIGCGEQLSFFSYKDLEKISIEIQQPSDTTQAFAIARGAFSLLVGNWAGVGYASGMMTTRGTVKFILPDHKECTSAECAVADLERLASIIEPLRNDKILSHVSV